MWRDTPHQGEPLPIDYLHRPPDSVTSNQTNYSWRGKLKFWEINLKTTAPFG